MITWSLFCFQPYRLSSVLLSDDDDDDYDNGFGGDDGKDICLSFLFLHCWYYNDHVDIDHRDDDDDDDNGCGGGGGGVVYVAKLEALIEKGSAAVSCDANRTKTVCRTVKHMNFFLKVNNRIMMHSE